jgi:thiol-disulfide isomerase/thioredoxin
MWTKRALGGLAAGWVLLGGALAPLWAAPTVAQMLAYEPKQKGVVCSMPTAEEQKLCTIEPVKNSKGATRGWLLVDARKMPLRRFYDANGDDGIDLFSYYKDGVEVYRETDSNFNKKLDQFRWLNAGGMKWGVSSKEDGVIDVWRMISPEEVAEEVFMAVAERNPARLRALLINENELRALKLPAEKTEAMRKTLKGALVKFDKTIKDLPGIERATFVRVESAVPSCLLAEESGGEQDLIHYPTRPILYETADGKGDKKHEWLHTGQMIRVGLCWRLVDAPTSQPDMFATSGGNSPSAAAANNHSPQLQKLLERLSDLDKSSPAMPPGQISRPVQEYNIARVNLIQQILAQPDLKADERETWIKQVCDNLSNAHIAGHQAALGQLAKYKDQILKGDNAALSAYAAYRHLWASYAPKLQDVNNKSLQKTQEEWLEKLAEYVRAYPRGEDTPEALLQLGMGSEFGGRDDEAKRWYQQLATNFADHPLAGKAKGAQDRLNLVGNELKLSGPMLSSNQPFDITRLRGKVVVVYYWASYCNSCIGEFARLNQLKSTHGSKGLELVLVNLDDRADDAVRFLQKNPLNAFHLFQSPGQNMTGLQSSFATQYGIMGLPNVFLVGRDGKVISRTLQVNDLEEAVRKAL